MKEKIYINVIVLLLIYNVCNSQTKKVNNSLDSLSKIDIVVNKILPMRIKNTDTIAQFIINNFSSSEHKLRAVFYWTANYLEYDLANMFAINIYESSSKKIEKALLTKKGICEDYALVFVELCNKLNIRTYLVDGYTKQNGFNDYIPHAWCVCKLNNKWYFYDPTWGSGYVSNKKFYKKMNNNFYMVEPNKFIKTHMPFDYLFQFLNYPITNKEFVEGKTNKTASKVFFNFSDSLLKYEAADSTEKLLQEQYRIETNDVNNAMIFSKLHNIKVKLENIKIDKLNELNRRNRNTFLTMQSYYSKSIDKINEFITFKNNQFKPTKPDVEIKALLDSVSINLNLANDEIEKLQDLDQEDKSTIERFIKSIDELKLELVKQQEWINEYMSKGKNARKAMFYESRLTLFGIPLD